MPFPSGITLKQAAPWLFLASLGIALLLAGGGYYLLSASSARLQAHKTGQRAVYNVAEQAFLGDFPYSEEATEEAALPAATPAAAPPPATPPVAKTASPSASTPSAAPAPSDTPSQPQEGTTPTSPANTEATATSTVASQPTTEDIAPQLYWQQQASAFTNPDRRPIIALVITNAGLSERHGQLLEELPAAISIAYSPYPQHIRDMATSLHNKGHEMWLSAPMEPPNFPYADPGDKALLTTLKPKELQSRLRWLMQRLPAVGLVSDVSEKFTHYQPTLETVYTELRQKQWLFLRSQPDNNAASLQASAATQYPVLHADSLLDSTITTDHIQQQLAKLEARAKDRGFAIGVGRPYPPTLETIERWSRNLAAKGFVLAPLSAVMQGQHPGKAPGHGQ